MFVYQTNTPNKCMPSASLDSGALPTVIHLFTICDMKSRINDHISYLLEYQCCIPIQETLAMPMTSR